MNGHAAQDLWHLTIDDLLATPADAPRLQGPGPFVINLSASTAPITVPSALSGYEHLLVYQLKHTEDGRTRFRLRLGPIASELEADAILSAVREQYPSAFAANAAADDLKVFERKGARSTESKQPSSETKGGESPAEVPVSEPQAASALEHMLAPDPHPALDVDAAAELEAEIELTPRTKAAAVAPGAAVKAEPAAQTQNAQRANKTQPPITAKAPPALAPAEESAEFAIDFDALLPPMDVPAGASPAAKPAAPPPAAGSSKRKKREHTKAPPAVRHKEPVKNAKAAKHPEVSRQPDAPKQQAKESPPPAPRFVEPPHDPNAVTDQVAVLAVPDAAVELTLDDAVESMIVPVLSDAPEHDLDMSGVMPAMPMPMPTSQPAPIRDDADLASVVARNNAMVDALEARGDRPAESAARTPESPATEAEPVAVPVVALTAGVDPPPPVVQSPPVVASSIVAAAPTVGQTALASQAANEVLAAIAAAPKLTGAQAAASTVQAAAIAQVEAPADIEADVDDFTSTIVGVEGEQEIEALLDEVPTLVPVSAEALAAQPASATEPEPPELVDAIEPSRAARRTKRPAAPTAADVEPVTLTDAVTIEHGKPVAVAEVAAIAAEVVEARLDVTPAIDAPVVEALVVEASDIEVFAIEAPAAASPVAELTLAPDGPLPITPKAAPVEAVAVTSIDASIELSLLDDSYSESVVESAPVAQSSPVVEPAPIEEQPQAATPIPEEDVIEVLEAVAGAKILSEPLPDVDSTQTIRELTPLELADSQGSQYFAIQLSLSDEAVNPDDVPHLDIFDAYRLYSVAGMHQGAFKHALRLGFFSDAGSAEMVAGYLRCYFESPAVKRVANAERDRFSKQRVVPKRDVGATGAHTVIELSTAVRVPERRLADISNNPRHRSSDSGSLWSRLVAPLKR